MIADRKTGKDGSEAAGDDYTVRLLRVSRDPGSALHQARRKQGMSLKDVAERLKTTIDVIGRLERWQLDGLMEERFLRSLVKRYAVLMGLRPEPLLDLSLIHI